MVDTTTNNASLSALARVFLKLGFTGFGGPAVHIAMMRTEVVEKRNWLTEREFLDLLGAVHLIPGPNSTELAIFIGYRLQRWKGLVLAGLCFILPAFFIVLMLAMLYQKFGGVPDLNPILIGMRPVVISIVLLALLNFGKTAIFNFTTTMVFLISVLMSWFGVNELVIIFGLGLFSLSFNHFAPAKKLSLSLELFLFFLKVGSVLFGSGYVLLAFLQRGLVEDLKWLTETQLIDAITIGQVTPGPVFTTATFIGYLINGFEGATVSTLGIFLPSFILVALIAPFVVRLRTSKPVTHFLDGVNAASLGLMVIVLVQLAQKSLINIPAIFLGIFSMVFLLKFKNVNSVFLLIFGGLVGFFFL